MNLRLLTAVLLLAGAALAEPQFPTINSSTPLPLDTLISLGFQYNPGLRQTAMNTRLNTIGNMNAVGNFLPTVSLGMSFSQTHYKSPTFQNPNGSVSTFPITTTVSYVRWDTLPDGITLTNPHLATQTVVEDVPTGDTRSSSESITLNESIFEGGRRYFLYRLAKTQSKINDLNVVDGRKILASEIAQQVVLVLTQDKLLALNKKLRDQQQDAYDLAKARFDVGAVTELDVLQAQILLNTAENNITSAQRDLQSAQYALNQLLGIDIKSIYAIQEGTVLSPYVFEPDSLVSEAYRFRTDLRIADLTVKRATANLNMQYANYFPQISLGASFSKSEQSGKETNWTLSPRDENDRYSLNLTWNLFDGFSREYNVQTQRVARDQAIEGRRALLLNLEQQVRNAYNSLQVVYGQATVSSKNRDLSERNLNLVRERYRLGAASALDLRDAEVTYAQAETDNLSKELQYQSSLIALELAVGKSLH